MLNEHFVTVMQCLHGVLKSEDTLKQNIFHPIADSFNTCIECCDSDQLKDSMFHLLETLLQSIGEFFTNPATMLPNCNKETREIFLNNYCSSVQPLLVGLGSESVSDQLMQQIVELVRFCFNQSQSVCSGGLFILNGLVGTVGERIVPHIHSFSDYLVCAIKWENTDEMGVRMACGLISDLGNNCTGNIISYLPQIMGALQNVMGSNEYETEAKIHAITAMGDACLASEQNFANYLQSTMKSFEHASRMSVNKGRDEDEELVLSKLRSSLVDAYISILHGMNPDKDKPELAIIPQHEIDTHAQQMYYFLEALVNNTDLHFESGLLKEMFELFFDLIVIFVAIREGQPQPPHGGMNYRAQTQPYVSAICGHMLQSDLIAKMEPGLGFLDSAD